MFKKSCRVALLAAAAAFSAGASAHDRDDRHQLNHEQRWDRHEDRREYRHEQWREERFEHRYYAHPYAYAPARYRSVYYPRYNVYYVPDRHLWYRRRYDYWEPVYYRPRETYAEPGVSVYLNVPLW